MCISIVISLIWNGYLLTDYVMVRLIRKTKAGVKEAKKTDVHK